MTPMLIIGLAGSTTILVGFLLNQRKILSEDDTRYDLLNAIGSLLLVIYAIDGRAWPFVILNSVWMLYSGADVIKDLYQGHRAKK